MTFAVGDACELRTDLGQFDAILLANLIDRLPDPAACLQQMARLMRPGGILAIVSPYTWLAEFTPEEKWLDADPLVAIQALLGERFRQLATRDLPFVIREHARKYQWSVAQASVWTCA
ncbi:MAG: ubiquinone/menaquinone biosynthesis C-methylase UbiE [Rhodothermales bacterium]|jgi:ubiquinone/menaquinone biosynthesis C-methylase UbiE